MENPLHAAGSEVRPLGERVSVAAPAVVPVGQRQLDDHLLFVPVQQHLQVELREVHCPTSRRPAQGWAEPRLFSKKPGDSSRVLGLFVCRTFEPSYSALFLQNSEPR